MWDIDLKIGKVYGVISSMFATRIDKSRTYTILKDGKLYSIIDGIDSHRKGIFKINKIIKYKINWRHPFQKREISEVFIECLDSMCFK